MSVDTDDGVASIIDDWFNSGCESLFGDTITTMIGDTVFTEIDEYAPVWRGRFDNAEKVKEVYRNNL